MEAGPTVSVVIPTYNRAQRLPRVLAPLFSDDGAAEIIVVVDGSRDGSMEVLEGLAAGEPRLRPIFVENGGEMAARGTGARAARSDVVLFLDDDVLASPGLVAAHGAHHAGRDDNVVVGYMPIELSPRRTASDFATRLYAREYEGRCATWEDGTAAVLDHLWGGNFSMRREACLKVEMDGGGYQERYHPDQEFGLRLKAAGLRGTFDRALVAQHLHERSLEAFARDARSQGAGRVSMHRLHPDLAPAVDPGTFEAGLGPVSRSVMRMGARERAGDVVGGALRLLTRAAGLARVWAVQDRAGRLLRRLEQSRGAREAAQR